jgi:hypothetical protein
MFSLVLLTVIQVPGQVELPAAKPVPAWQILPLPEQQASVEHQGRELARYNFGKELYRPFLYPIVGPSGRSLTRMGHPRDPNGHSHHNSFWVSHHDVGGVAFWNDAKSSAGRIVHQRVNRYEESDEEALIDVQNHWIDSASSGRVILEERRVMRFQSQQRGQWLLVLDITLAAPKQAVTLGKTNFGLIGVRMAKTIGVHDGGGMIRNSEGAINEPQVHEKAARWVDYSGPITPEKREGITLLDHPQNFNHPSVFHVRDDGWMGAALTFADPHTIEPGQPLTVRYGLWIHEDVPTAAQIDNQFANFAKIGPPAK